MPSKRNLKIVFLCLLLMLITAPLSCKNRENPAQHGKKKINFYNGIKVRPLYSKSFVKKPHSRYTFPPVLQGDIVEHDFIIENDSKSVLKLSNAEGCCGCIVSSYTRRIQPGLSGKISALFLTDSRGGKEIKGTIRADTNDKDRPEITIDVSLYVKEFAALDPYRIWLKGSPAPEEDIVEKCTVIPNENYPFHITGIKTRKGVWFDYSYREIKKDGKNAYEITVKNTRKKPGSYQDVLFVQTDNSARPEFKIRIEGRISK